MNRKKWMAGVLACVLALALSVPTLAAEPLTFSDVPEKHWAHTAIMDMTEKGMFKGTSHAVNGVGTFSPDAPMSRAAFVTVMVRYLYPNEIQSATAGQKWWEPYAAVAKAHGLIADGELTDMDGAMLRQEMAVVLVRAAEQQGESVSLLVNTKHIADYGKIESTYRTYVRKCFTLGLIAGIDKKGTFAPLGEMNRAQAATVIYRLMNPATRAAVDLSDASENGGWTNTGGEASGSDNITVTGGTAGQLVPDSTLTKWGLTRPASRVSGGDWDTYNGFLFQAYNRYFVSGGIGQNAEDAGTFAKAYETNGGFEVEVFEWRKSYASSSSTNRCLNMVMEAFYYACGDRDVAYALWSVVDFLQINGSAATTVEKVESFGFTTSNETNSSITLSMNGVNIIWEYPSGSSSNYFTFN